MAKRKLKNHQLNLKALLFPIIASTILLLIKSYGWFATDSLSILSSLLDSTFDLIVSILNILALIYASKPPDNEHRFGHNSMEDIVGLIQATFVGASGVFIIYEAIRRFINPEQIREYETGILVMFVSLIVALAIVIYQKITFRKTKSIIVESDMMHYMTDFLINGSIIISLFLVSKTGIEIIDPILATLIAIYIIHAALKIGKRSFNHLMDHELDDDEREKIKELVYKDKNIKGHHAFKTRRSGSRVFIQIHIELDKKLSLEEGHDIADRLEKKLGKAWEPAEIIIHTDPV
jgi:ferrous-iron efflux pump FieF